MAVSVAACSKKDNDSGSRTLRVGAADGGPGFIILTNKQNYFKDEGVTVDWQNVGDPTTALAAIQLGNLDVNTVALVPTLQQIAKGVDFTIFAGNRSEGGEVITTAENAANFTGLESFKGKKFAVIHLDTADYNLRKLLREQGIIPGVDVTYTEFPDYVAVQEALKKGAVDYAVTVTEMARASEKQGLASVLKVRDLVPSYVCCRQVALTSDIKEHRQEYVNYVKAQIKGYQYLKENEDAAITYLAEVKAREKDAIKADLFAEASAIFNPEPATKKVADFYNLLVNEGADGFTGTTVDINAHVDSTIFRDAIEEIRKETPNNAVIEALYAEFQKNN
jgi:NitT/TauT family transport system substrate-binding protein